MPAADAGGCVGDWIRVVISCSIQACCSGVNAGASSCLGCGSPVAGSASLAIVGLVTWCD